MDLELTTILNPIRKFETNLYMQLITMLFSYDFISPYLYLSP